MKYSRWMPPVVSAASLVTAAWLLRDVAGWRWYVALPLLGFVLVAAYSFVWGFAAGVIKAARRARSQRQTRRG